MHGYGELTGPRSVTVGDQSFTARRGIVIATGSQPAIPPIPGLADVEFWTTHDAIECETLPQSIVVLGGGAVGCELGQVFSRFGVDVTIVEGMDRLLPLEEPEASTAIATAFDADGIAVHTGVLAEKVEARGDSFVVTLAGGTEVQVTGCWWQPAAPPT